MCFMWVCEQITIIYVYNINLRGFITRTQCTYCTVWAEFVNTFQFNLLNPTGYVMHQQFNIQQLYVLLTLYLCVLYLSENKQRLVPLTA